MANLAINVSSISVNGSGQIVAQYSADAGPAGSVTSSCHVAFSSSTVQVNNDIVADAITKMQQLNPGFTFGGSDVAKVFGGAV
jgi:hypothetical protein